MNDQAQLYNLAARCYDEARVLVELHRGHVVRSRVLVLKGTMYEAAASGCVVYTGPEDPNPRWS